MTTTDGTNTTTVAPAGVTATDGTNTVKLTGSGIDAGNTQIKKLAKQLLMMLLLTRNKWMML